jgi:hypothetical protein
VAQAKGAASAPALPAQVRRWRAGRACAARIPVKVVVVTMFEIGQDTGDAPGEFQFWRERRKLDVRIPFPQSHHDLYYNPKSQILGMVTGMGSIRSATATLALGLDQRFDLSHAYWLVAGIAGVDPHQATIGSAVWAHYLVDGDLAHEIDAREMPRDWPSGYFPLNAKGPLDKHPQSAEEGEMFALNAGLADWAYGLTKGITLPDSADLAKARAPYTDTQGAGRAARDDRRQPRRDDLLARRDDDAMGARLGRFLDRGQGHVRHLGDGGDRHVPVYRLSFARGPGRSQPRDGAARGVQFHDAAARRVCGNQSAEGKRELFGHERLARGALYGRLEGGRHPAGRLAAL